MVLAVQKGEIGVVIFFANCMFSHRFLLSSSCTTFDQVRRYILERKFCQKKEGKKKKLGTADITRELIHFRIGNSSNQG